MIAQTIAETVKRQIADSMDIVTEDGYLRIGLPFMHSDGDHYELILRPDGKEWLVTDDGDIVAHAGYAGVNLLASDRVDRLNQLTAFYGLRESEGELSKSVPEDGCGLALMEFAQACFDISRLAKVPAEKKQSKKLDSKFHKKTKEIIYGSVTSDLVTPKWHHPEIDPVGTYIVDFSIMARKRQLLLFGVGTPSQLMRASITSLHYRQTTFEFDSVAIVNDERSQHERERAFLDDAMTVVFPVSDVAGVKEYLAEMVA